MITNVEKLDNSMVKITIEAEAKLFEDEIQKVYLKNKKHISLPGFRKGKAPRIMIERAYGKEIFYEDAANELIHKAYVEALDESDLEIVSKPEIDVVQIEKGKPFIFTAQVAVKPQLTLGLYKGIEVELSDATVDDEDVEIELDKIADKNSRLVDVTDRAVENGDEVNIDFEGFVDGEAFEGGKADGHDLTIGSGSFIDDFEEQLIGVNIGEECEVNVTFPEDYAQESLAGKPALFKVKVNGIKVKELPEIDDEFADDVSDFETLAEYKEDIRKRLVEEREHARKHEKEDKVLQKVVELVSVELPEPMVELETEQLADEFNSRLRAQGLTLEMYLQFTGGNMATFMSGLKEQAENRIKTRLTLEEIVKIEELDATDEEIDAEIERIAKQYDMEIDKLKETLGEKEKESVKKDLLNKKAVELIVNEAIEK